MAEAMFNIRNELLRVEHETDGDTASVTLAAAVLDFVSPNGLDGVTGGAEARAWCKVVIPHNDGVKADWAGLSRPRHHRG